MEMLKKRAAARGQGGFTLIELLVVIAILAILAGVVVFAVGNSTDNAKVSACKTEFGAIKTAIAAAETANEVESTTEDPDDYMESNNQEYFDWGGSTNAWILTIVDGTITTTSDAPTACAVFDN